ncbi:DUF5134 domain-containing protein [Streptomyces acidiscabies]|uniref:DUF5134 domain-containing protein n=2 Tax=Streptomyces acidiscabies TaxID=42234 RepID=A0AAP6BEZ9_9ACTN|nr:DUF5134 domain-containing protein [Streptomyces acidiscabies]MDX2963443.1 DUF5134 domain-containing protein [Streptomyces acidiscabies]MDX3023177.1 DUF5134 domain-containing protein [Streptomyces acidiscabies]MDX3792677.1 DUF5134 domain-containing protein [Streptomyces acidiscabies]GAQ51379.1 hypothetical protein a10_01159 [Streptomyces acidiscabies]GAV38477.1 hypothetical protein Saa2_01357 [Streptomyces acidiscabies]
MATPADIVHGMLTVLFTAVAAHALRQGVRPARPRDRADHLLHFTMATAMAAMPWSLGRPLSGPTTTALFTAAALWFPLTALHRRTTDTAARIAARLPSAAGMAAMAWMLRTTAHTHEPSADGVTALLTVYLLACALRSLTLPMPSLRSATDTQHRTAATDPYGHSRDGAMALGTALMLLMPH